MALFMERSSKKVYIYFGWNLQEFKISFNITQKSINFKQKKIYVNEMYVRFTKKDLESDWNFKSPKNTFSN